MATCAPIACLHTPPLLLRSCASPSFRSKLILELKRNDMARTQQWKDGRRNGIKFAITFLHRTAHEMNDPHAKCICNLVGFWLGIEAKKLGRSSEVERAADRRQVVGSNPSAPTTPQS
jgi:hypothetical protein